MEQVVLNVEKRDVAQGGLGDLRRAGFIPAVLYGNKMESLALSMVEKDFTTVIHKTGGNAIFSLRIGKESFPALMREVQHDPVSEAVLHVDFYNIDMDKEIETDVPLELTGIAAGVTQGGVLDVHRRHLRVRCLPNVLPANLIVDIEALEIGMALHVSDVKTPDGVEIVTEPRLTIITLAAPTKIEEPEAAVTDEAGEAAGEGAPVAADGEPTEKEKAPAPGDK